MIPHDSLMAAKIVMLENLVSDILIDRFGTFADPVVAAEAYAEKRRHAPKHADPDPELDVIYEAVWGEFLDRVVAGVRKGQAGRKP
jgi:hypothetical protein